MMHTRCPACQTTFRLTLEQIKARHGKVRCGRCQNVFDALEHLVESIATVAAQVQAPATTASDAEVAEASASPAAPPATTLEHAVDTTSEASQSVLPEVESSTAPPEDGHEIPRDLSPASPLAADPLATIDNDSSLQSRLRIVWRVACVFAVLALLLQATLYWRVELATRYPDLRPKLEALCQSFDCSVGLPTQSALLKIENSDLVPGKQGRLELAASLHNLAAYAQEWPHLELTLTDAADRPVARRVITPQEYAAPAAGGFPANGEFAVQVRLDIASLPAAGYRLYLFYP